MAVIPCSQNTELQSKIEAFAEVLKTQTHLLGNHGLQESEFYQSGILRGAIERVRGQFSAAQAEKRLFLRAILNHLQDLGMIIDYEESSGAARHDFLVTMPEGRTAAIAAKGCLDGNNTNVFERPAEVGEFLIWSICTNPGADPRRNAWSGLHTRLSAEIIERRQRVDGVVIWDWICGTVGRPCPKLPHDDPRARTTEVGPWRLTPPCIYLMPRRIPSPDDPEPQAWGITETPLLLALHRAFKGLDAELNAVSIEVQQIGEEAVRRTTVTRGGAIVRQSELSPIRRR